MNHQRDHGLRPGWSRIAINGAPRRTATPEASCTALLIRLDQGARRAMTTDVSVGPAPHRAKTWLLHRGATELRYVLGAQQNDESHRPLHQRHPVRQKSQGFNSSKKSLSFNNLRNYRAHADSGLSRDCGNGPEDFHKTLAYEECVVRRVMQPFQRQRVDDPLWEICRSRREFTRGDLPIGLNGSGSPPLIGCRGVTEGLGCAIAFTSLQSHRRMKSAHLREADLSLVIGAS
jgi:hypothetical protein